MRLFRTSSWNIKLAGQEEYQKAVVVCMCQTHLCRLMINVAHFERLEHLTVLKM